MGGLAVPSAAAPAALATASAAPRAAAAASGPVLEYTFDALSAGKVPDVSGHGLDGTLRAASGSATLAAGLAGHGKAIKLTGTKHQWVDVPQLPVLDVTTYTLSAWVRSTGVQNDETNDRWEVLEKAGSYWMNVRTNHHVRVGGFYGGCTSASWKFFDSTATVPVNTWRHVASTYDGTTLRVYVNGTPSGSMAVSGAPCVSGEPLAVGAKNNPTKGLLEAFWDGKLDDVRVYDRALSAAEIKQLAVR
jgi:hypothetical protein